ncbi:MAG TPA: hypothetical protein VL990_14270 [Acidobacteriaceae bacterium]|nr:hypothetical protein [Acidobacteriaceae bacterium]
MAKPIALEIAPRDARKELVSRLENAPAAHAEALLDAYELIEEAHAAGVFEMLRGVLSAKDKVVEAAVKETATPQAIHALRNGIILARMLGSINPDLMECYAAAVGDTLGSERRPVIEPPGLLSLLGQFRRTELRRSIALINRFLESLGNRLKEKGCSPPAHEGQKPA